MPITKEEMQARLNASNCIWEQYNTLPNGYSDLNHIAVVINYETSEGEMKEHSSYMGYVLSNLANTYCYRVMFRYAVLNEELEVDDFLEAWIPTQELALLLEQDEFEVQTT